MRKALVKRWTDRVVRTYASAALQLAGFASAAVALASTPEIVDEASAHEASARVNAALHVVLAAREVPQIEAALVATFAAREALALVQLDDPSVIQLQGLVETLHVIA